MKVIYVNNKVLNEALGYLNDEITFFSFLLHTKAFLKELLTNPISAQLDDFLIKNGLSKKDFLKLLSDRDIIQKETKIESVDDNDRFMVSYKIPKKNFERKMRRLFSFLFEKNEIVENQMLDETDCGGAMQGGGSNPDAGQFIQPIAKVQRRKIYLTKEQAEIIKEMVTCDAGHYQYDVPFKFNNGNDPVYNHKNMVKSGIPKKKGVRKKVKKNE